MLVFVHMNLPIQITFRDLPPSDALTAYVDKRAQKLDRFFDRITSCRVAIEEPHRHSREGKRFRVRIDLTVPGEEIVVGHARGDDESCEDAYAAVDAAFDHAKRRLEEWARRKRESARAV